MEVAVAQDIAHPEPATPMFRGLSDKPAVWFSGRALESLGGETHRELLRSPSSRT